MIAEKSLQASRAKGSCKDKPERIDQKEVLHWINLSYYPGTLADCVFQKKTLRKAKIYIVEGDSAGGSAKTGS